MSGLGGFDRDPRQGARSRRSQQRLSGTKLWIGNGTALDSDGRITLDLAENGGLSNGNDGISILVAANEPFNTSSSGLSLVLTANGGLSDANGSLTVVFNGNEPIGSNSTGLFLRIGSSEPLSKSGGNLSVNLASNGGLSKSGGNLSVLINANEPLTSNSTGMSFRIGANEPISKSGGNLSFSNGTTIKKSGGLAEVAAQGANRSIQVNNNGNLSGSNASLSDEGYLSLPGGLRILGFVSTAAAPTTIELAANKDVAVHRNTANGTIALAYNDNGTIRSVVLA